MSQNDFASLSHTLLNLFISTHMGAKSFPIAWGLNIFTSPSAPSYLTFPPQSASPLLAVHPCPSPVSLWNDPGWQKPTSVDLDDGELFRRWKKRKKRRGGGIKQSREMTGWNKNSKKRRYWGAIELVTSTVSAVAIRCNEKKLVKTGTPSRFTH